MKKFVATATVFLVLISVLSPMALAAVNVSADIEGRVSTRYYPSGNVNGSFRVAVVNNGNTYSLYLMDCIPSSQLIFNVDPQIGLLNIEGRGGLDPKQTQAVQSLAVANMSGRSIVVKITGDMGFLHDSYNRPTATILAGSWFKATLK
jgi:hypothetical protein